jgi:hypothetical protein
METVTNAANAIGKAIYGDSSNKEDTGSKSEGNTQRADTAGGQGRGAVSDDIGGNYHDIAAKYKPYEPSTKMRQEDTDTRVGGREQVLGRDTETASGYGKPAPSSDVSGIGGRQEEILVSTKETRPAPVDPESSKTNLSGTSESTSDPQTLSHERSSKTELPSMADSTTKSTDDMTSKFDKLTTGDTSSSVYSDTPAIKTDPYKGTGLSHDSHKDDTLSSRDYKDNVSTGAVGGFTASSLGGSGLTSKGDSTLGGLDNTGLDTTRYGAGSSTATSDYPLSGNKSLGSSDPTTLTGADTDMSGLGRSQNAPATSHVDTTALFGPGTTSGEHTTGSGTNPFTAPNNNPYTASSSNPFTAPSDTLGTSGNLGTATIFPSHSKDSLGSAPSENRDTRTPVRDCSTLNSPAHSKDTTHHSSTSTPHHSDTSTSHHPQTSTSTSGSIPLDDSAPRGPTHVSIGVQDTASKPGAMSSISSEPSPSNLSGAVHGGPSTSATGTTAMSSQNPHKTPSGAQQGSARPGQDPEHAHADESSSGGGSKYVRTSGLASEGGDFDATKPGAGREADRLLDEKGVPHGEKHGSHGGHDDEGHGKMKVTDKIKGEATNR